LLQAADHGGWAAPNQKLSPQTRNHRPKPKINKERNAMSSLSLLALLGRIFDPLAALLDEAATSTRAREVARVKLAAVKADAFSAALAFE
jgi:hypothetical protein